MPTVSVGVGIRLQEVGSSKLPRNSPRDTRVQGARSFSKGGDPQPRGLVSARCVSSAFLAGVWRAKLTLSLWEIPTAQDRANSKRRRVEEALHPKPSAVKSNSVERNINAHMSHLINVMAQD